MDSSTRLGTRNEDNRGNNNSYNNSNNNDDDDNAEWETLLNGEDFITEEERREREAERRRQERKRRLQQLQNPGSSPPPQKQQQLQQDEAPLPLNHQEERNNKDISMKLTTEKQKAENDETNNIDGGVMISSENHPDHEEEFDMFSTSVSPVMVAPNTGVVVDQPTQTSVTKSGHDQADWDDAEGYYKAVIGETISLLDNTICLRVMGVVGKGVFSTVVKCTTISNSSSAQIPPLVAMKVIRFNETMAKAALNELQTLQKLKGSPGIVPLILPTGSTPLDFRGHVVMLFTFMDYNLRDVLQKFGKGVGLSLQAVRSYFGQLLAAATHLQKHGIIHADLKPDNILVSSDFGAVQLADFGSAIHVNSPEQASVTPYLVSRFYRAPEIILGLPPTHSVDLWSLAVSVTELFLGDVVFRGKTNNDMLYVFMQHLGPFSNRIIRQHMVQCQKLPIPRHFRQDGPNFNFTLQTIDTVSGTPVHKVLSLQPNNSNDPKFPLATPLKTKLLKAKSANDSKRMVNQFADLVQQCLALDPSRRIALKDALRHEFFQQTKDSEK